MILACSAVESFWARAACRLSCLDVNCKNTLLAFVAVEKEGVGVVVGVSYFEVEECLFEAGHLGCWRAVVVGEQ